MAKWKKYALTTISLLALICLIIVIGAYNSNIINGQYEKITITKKNKTTEIITDKDEINRIVDRINNSPRKFFRKTGFSYDYLPYGFLTFENDKEKVEHAFFIYKGNMVIGHWDIDTKFEFAKDLE